MKSAHFLFTLPSFCFSSLCLPPPFSLSSLCLFSPAQMSHFIQSLIFFIVFFMALVSPPTPLPLLTHTSHCLCVFPWLSPTFSLSSFLLYLRFQLFSPLSETSVSLLSLSTLFAITHYPLLVSFIHSFLFLCHTLTFNFPPSSVLCSFVFQTSLGYIFNSNNNMRNISQKLKSKIRPYRNH